MVLAQSSLLDRVFHLLADNPNPEDILALYTTEEESNRITELAQKNRANELTYSEEQEMQQYLLAERYVRMAKAKALERLSKAGE
jgi:hypothetical protein